MAKENPHIINSDTWQTKRGMGISKESKPISMEEIAARQKEKAKKWADEVETALEPLKEITPEEERLAEHLAASENFEKKIEESAREEAELFTLDAARKRKEKEENILASYGNNKEMTEIEEKRSEDISARFGKKFENIKTRFGKKSNPDKKFDKAVGE